MKKLVLIAATALAACTASHAAPEPKGRDMLSERTPPKPSTFWVWATRADARNFASQHPHLCLYEVPDGVATGSCRRIRVPVDGVENAKELSGPRWLGRYFDCLEYIPSRHVLQTCEEPTKRIPLSAIDAKV